MSAGERGTAGLVSGVLIVEGDVMSHMGMEGLARGAYSDRA